MAGVCISRMMVYIVLLILTLAGYAHANQPPRFTNFNQILIIREDEAVGSVVGRLEAEDQDTDQLDFFIRGEIANDLFELNRTDKKEVDIILKSALDREVVDQYTVLFEVRDSLNAIQRYATVYVNDVNDNTPTFINLPYRATVPEDARLGTFVYKVSATDPDRRESPAIYNITSLFIGSIKPDPKVRDGLFEINRDTGNVTLHGGLDYELEQFYQLEIIAVDGGGLNSTTDLIINVEDVQDTAPYFLNLPYIASVNENAQVGSPILQVTALDGDRGIPNPVNYTFMQGEDSDIFDIDATTGWITVKEELDREKSNILEKYGVIELQILTQEVTSSPQGLTEAMAPVTIRILDVNDEAPSFEQAYYEASVPENTYSRIPLTMIPANTNINVRDLDEGTNGHFTLHLEKDGAPFDVFMVTPTTALNEATAVLRVKEESSLDYERVQNYTFQIVARETYTSELYENRTTVTVNVIDVNDNLPEFDQESYNATIRENSARGTPVITITGTDSDSGVFGAITYSLRGGSTRLFSVDSSTGEVTVSVDGAGDHTLLDRERIDTHFLTFEASDGGGLRTLVQLEVKLSDVNDNTPDIARPYYEGFVQENSLTLDRPVVIEATDLDLYPNNVISYYIMDGNEAGNFTLHPDTGVVSLTGPLNYEGMDPTTGGQFVLTVGAQDGGSPALTSSVQVTINVQDVNDEQPYFQPNYYWSSVAENSVEGTNVTHVFAFDDDGTAPNNDVVYRIESGARDKFRIDADTGVIIVDYGADLDRDVYDVEYTLVVVAIDRGTPPLSGSAQVNVTITDINNKLPTFSPPQSSTSLNENTTVGENVFVFQAVDPDESALLRYSLLTDEVYGEDEDGQRVDDVDYLNTLFAIHPHNGTVYVSGELNRERVQEVVIAVHVADLNAEQPPQQSATGYLTLTLNDVNDNPPEFTPTSIYTARISEASKPGAEVTRVVAIDRDKYPRPITYYMVYGDGSQSDYSRHFVITEEDREAGIISLAETVDHENTEWVNVTVRAVDAGSPPLSSLATVHIDIQDVNDNSPEWKVFEDTVSVWENASPDEYVTTVQATDLDSAEFGPVVYYIGAGDEGKFTIHNETGVIRTLGNLNREDTPTYLLTVVASDNPSAPPTQRRTTPRPMRVILRDINDNHPQFDEILYEETVLENALVPSSVITITASDTDEGVNGEIQYSISEPGSNSSGLFAINEETGEVSVVQSLQGTMGVYRVVVVAADKGSPPLTNTTILYVHVQDVNDHPPQIYEPPVNKTINLLENVDVGYFVTHVRARDLDAGQNGVVHYEFVDTPSNDDWQTFVIDRLTGNVTTAREIDRETQSTYYVEVRAYDLGTPSYEDRHTVVIDILDVDDNPPTFDRVKYPPPYTVSVLEEQTGVYVGDLGLAEDPDVDMNAVTCYYIVGGDSAYMDHFHINKTNGRLFLNSKLDREDVTLINLVIKATQEHCSTDHYERDENRQQTWDPDDISLLWVEVKVMDVNDNPPRYSKRWFTAGVTRDTQFGSDVIDLSEYAHDPDEGQNAAMTFMISSPFRISEQLNRDLDGKVPFTLDRDSGIIRTNVYFQELWEGYMEFEVSVNDSNADHVDRANVSIYLLSENQRVKVIIRGKPNDAGGFKDTFAEFVSNITGTIINVDNIRTHKDSSGDPDERKTDMFIHAINRQTGEVLSADVLVDLIDRNYRHLVDLFKQYNVIEVVPAVEPVVSSSTDTDLLLALIVVAVGLGLVILIVCATFIFCRKKYKRKLNAANAMAFGSNANTLKPLEVPGANIHHYEGSNPMWLEQYGNGWPPDSDTESKNSLDENNISPARQTPQDYDEEEMTMQMYSNDVGQYNKQPIHKDGDVFLRAALHDHERSQPSSRTGTIDRTSSAHSNQDNGMIDSSSYPRSKGKTPKKANGHSANGSVTGAYSNPAFSVQATKI